jgi:Restriction endonuclease
VSEAGTLPGEEAVRLLPRLAVVAFAARCARMAYARYTEFASWDSVTQAIESAISEAEQVAASGKFAASVFASWNQVHRALDSLRDSADAPGAMLLDLHYAAIAAADAAEAALRCAAETSGRMIPGNPARSAVQAAINAEAAAAPRLGQRSPDTERAICNAMALLVSAAADEQWTDESVVRPLFFVVDQSRSGAMVAAIRECCDALAWEVASNPQYLDELEWRDVERLMATVFSRLGFNVQLTPPSKDGGKDLVLECLANGRSANYVVEVKHWRSGKRVGTSDVKEFIRVVAREKRIGGLFLATYGYSANVGEAVSEIDRDRIRLGDSEFMTALCKTYVRAEHGVWQGTRTLPALLFSPVGGTS